ncbi:hypothetical protein BDF14DRAFT_396510 [Spinellus fusiger]|nr:hypothetical protein BDF14DRAFT_396510 [Spinellus fusiger]
MDSPHPILSASKELLHSLEVWFNGQTVQVQGVARMALEECWNSYYALSESTKTKDSKQQKENIAALYLDIARLKATLGMTEGGTRPDAIQEQAQLLRAWMETQAPEQEQTATVSSSSSKSIPLTVPPSPTPRPEKLKTVSTDEQAHVSPEQLERLLTGYAPASGLSHEHIAHEMIMDPNFKLYKREPESELEARVRTLATKAFFDRIREELTQGHPEISIPSLMNEIQGILHG